jgi:RNA 3'-terminal phosphate cyclase (ATP)
MGGHVDLRLERHGFYPAGGGRVVLELSPARLSPIEILDAGPVRRRRARAILSRLATHVGDRELAVVRERLGWRADECEVVDARSPGPGNALLLEIERDGCGEMTIGFGEKGTRAELVAETACRELEGLLASGMPVGEHLADQLLLPMALAGGGRFRAVPPSLHTTTNAEVIQRFLDVSVAIVPIEGGAEISVTR